jgi:predicted alpha/beta hydrolase
MSSSLAGPAPARGRTPPGRAPRRRRRRLLVRTLSVVVALLAVVWLAAAWYFSDVLYEDGLRVTPPPLVPLADVEVVAVDDDSITLAPGAHQPREASAPGTWGLWWEEGYGRLTEIERTSGGAVTRAFTRLDGVGPAVGTLTDVDKYVYGDTPDEVLGLTWEEVSFATPLGTQDAWFVPAGPNQDAGDETWAVLVHGKGSDRDEMLRMLRTVHEVGMSALVITYRGDRDQPVDPAGVYRFGATEWEDLDSAIRHALSEGATDVVLVGASTGAALIGSWFDHAEDTGSASGIVVDSPNADVEQTFAYGASQRTLPGTDWPLPPGLAWTAFRLAEARFPVDLSAVDYSDTLAAVDVPILVFHGSGDLTVPVEAAREVVAEREAAGLPTTYLESDAGEHVGSYNHDPEAYEAALAEFLRAVP